MASKNLYRVIFPSGETIVAGFTEVMLRLQQKFEITISRDLIHKRIRTATNHRAYAVDLVKPALTMAQAGARRWSNEGRPCVSFYSGVEGFDKPIAARQVWKVWVTDAGRSYPGRETIRKRLKAGFRTKAEIMEVDLSKLRDMNRSGPAQGIPTMDTPWRDTPLSRASRVIDVFSPEYRCPPLPEMKDWEGYDSGYYRRQPL